jgi:hypothetical protein
MKKIDKKHLERLETLEDMLWEKIKKEGLDNVETGKRFVDPLLKLYSDISFKLLRHKSMHNNELLTEKEECELDNILNEYAATETKTSKHAKQSKTAK